MFVMCAYTVTYLLDIHAEIANGSNWLNVDDADVHWRARNLMLASIEEHQRMTLCRCYTVSILEVKTKLHDRFFIGLG